MKYSQMAQMKHCPFETYKPKDKIRINKENTFPLFLWVFSFFAFLGGMLSFFASSLLMGVTGFFGFRRKIRSNTGKVIKYSNANKRFIKKRI